MIVRDQAARGPAVLPAKLRRPIEINAFRD
jgi:hypothetical protein